MITPDTKLSIALIPLECIQVRAFEIRDIDLTMKYYYMLLHNPGKFLGLLYLVPSDTHTGMYALLEGYKRYCAYILAGYHEALCVIGQEGQGEMVA